MFCRNEFYRIIFIFQKVKSICFKTNNLIDKHGFSSSSVYFFILLHFWFNHKMNFNLILIRLGVSEPIRCDVKQMDKNKTEKSQNMKRKISFVKIWRNNRYVTILISNVVWYIGRFVTYTLVRECYKFITFCWYSPMICIFL